MTRRPVHRRPALDAPLFDETMADLEYTPELTTIAVVLADVPLPSLHLLEPLP